MSTAAQSLPVAIPDETTPTAGHEAKWLRLAIALALGGLGWMMPYIAAIAVLLPQRLDEIDSTRKVVILGTLTVVGSLVALVANIAFGTFSDLTRSRFGRRNPWIVTGALAGGATMVMVANSHTIVTLAVSWCLFQVALNVMLAPLVATIADRVPVPRLGTVSAIYGTGIVLAQALGALIGAKFIANATAGFLIAGAIMVGAGISVVLIAPEPSAKDLPRQHLDVKAVIKSFALPRNARDFYWALVGRLILVVGYFMVVGYQLYILTDYMGLTLTEAGAIIATAALLTLGTALVAGLTSGPVSDRIGRRKLPVMAASLIIAAATLVPFLAAEPWTMLVFAAVAGFGFGIYNSIDMALIAEVLPTKAQNGKDLGILNMANTAGQMLAPALVSVIITSGAGYRAIFPIAAALLVAAALCIHPIKSVR